MNGVFCIVVMVFSREDLGVIKTCFEEKGWRGAAICRKFRSKKWRPRSVNDAIKKLERNGCIYRKPGSGRPFSSTGRAEICDAVEDLLQSQENEPGTHLSQRECAASLNVHRCSVQRIAKRRGLRGFKRLTAPQVEDAAVQRRLNRCKDLLVRFPTWKVKKMVFQDEKDFTLQVPTNRQNNRVYGKGKK